MMRRIATSCLQIVAISVIAFFLFSVVPGDFYSPERLESHGNSIAQWRVQRGLDRPWFARYASWIASCAKGDFGVSLAYGIPVTRLITPRLAKTAAIVLPGWTIGWFMAVSLATLAARRRITALEPVMTIANLVPEVIVVSLIVFLAVALRLAIDTMWLPFLAIVFSVAPLVFLHCFRALTEARSLNFVRIAESRGIPVLRLWRRFIFPAAANPLISLLGPSLAAAFGSSLAIEAITGWPGLGPLFLEAVQARDYEIVQAVVLVLAVALTFTNLAADLLLYRLDPRIRLGSDGAD